MQEAAPVSCMTGAAQRRKSVVRPPGRAAVRSWPALVVAGATAGRAAGEAAGARPTGPAADAGHGRVLQRGVDRVLQAGLLRRGLRRGRLLLGLLVQRRLRLLRLVVVVIALLGA